MESKSKFTRRGLPWNWCIRSNKVWTQRNIRRSLGKHRRCQNKKQQEVEGSPKTRKSHFQRSLDLAMYQFEELMQNTYRCWDFSPGQLMHNVVNITCAGVCYSRETCGKRLGIMESLSLLTYKNDFFFLGSILTRYSHSKYFRVSFSFWYLFYYFMIIFICISR